MELTQQEKNLLLQLVSQVTFKVGQSTLAQQYETIAKKLGGVATEPEQKEPVDNIDEKALS